MDDPMGRKSEEERKQKKKKRRRTDTEEQGREAASLPLSHSPQTLTLSSLAEDHAPILEKLNKKKLLREDAHTAEDLSETKKKKKKKRKKHSALKLEDLQTPHLEDESSHKNKAAEGNEDQDIHEGNLRRDNGENQWSEKKKEKKTKRIKHLEERNLLKEDNKEEKKRRKKKKQKEREEGKAEKAESPSQRMHTQFLDEDQEHRDRKKARCLAEEDGMGAGGKVGSNGSLKEDESASLKARKHTKESKNTVERAEKKEQKRKRVTFQDPVNATDQQHVRDIPNAALENSMEILNTTFENTMEIADEEVWGVRFTADEDEILKDAVRNYIKSKGWDEQEGLNKVFNSKKHKDAHNCWADIKLALPHRPRAAVRYRAHLLLEKGAHEGKWSEEEEQLLRRLQGEHGRKWKEISALIDRHRTSIKEKWRTLKRTKSKGVWTQGELQQLSDLVQKCLRAKALISMERKQSDHRILRDDINWEKIADAIGTHSHGSCCGKWYYNLQSSLVTDGLWANEDDLLLLESLLESGACTEEEVEWDSLLNHRSGQVCLTRWKQMVKHLGENRTRQFLDKLDILVRRYAPELLESSITESPSATAKISDS